MSKNTQNPKFRLKIKPKMIKGHERERKNVNGRERKNVNGVGEQAVNKPMFFYYNHNLTKPRWNKESNGNSCALK
jgi:hypothetical protein